MEEQYIFNGRQATVIIPENNANGYWIWRAEFLGAFDYADQELLKKGWHIAYYKVSNMYGCPEAVKLMKEFRDDFVKKYGLSQKADMFGFSRGGLYAVNYSIKYPQDISSIYLDAPVLDIFSWPGGRGKGKYDKNLWEECTAYYGASPETAKTITENPIDHMEELIKTKIPVILVIGGKDELVPYEENGELMYEAYKNHNAQIKVIIKPECGHHPHSLLNPKEIVDFISEARRNNDLKKS